jgi:hypothetical protein
MLVSPWTKPSWSSLESSSRVLFFVSGRSSVEKIPVNMNRAKISKLEYFSLRTGLTAKKEGKGVHVADECVRSTNVPQTSESDLGDDCTKLATCSRYSMSSRSVTSGECFSGDDEGCCVGPEVLEEVGKAVEEDEGFRGTVGFDEWVVGKAFASSLVSTRQKGTKLRRAYP